MQPDSRKSATLLGMLAILFWSTTIAFSRSLTEMLGVFTAASWIYAGSGALGVAYLICRPQQRRKLRAIPRNYWLGCGIFFVIYIVCFHSAVGLAHDRQQVVEVGLINYLWVSFTLLLSIPILKKKARWPLALGIVIACAGIVIVKSQTGALGWKVGGELFPAPYVLAFVAAIAWALFNNFSRKWGGATDGGAVPIFLLISGLVLLALRSCTAETPHYTPRVMLELAYMIVFPTLLAYIFWDVGMRKGKIILLASLSYLIPLLSTLISCAYLRVIPGPSLWLACAMVIGGAAICKRSVAD